MHEVPSTGGVVVAVHDLGGAGKPPLLLAHANGFHGRVFSPLAAHLSSNYHCLALDFRGHGDSFTPAGLGFEWPAFVDDVLAVVDTLDLAGAVAGFGHSLGGASLLGAEQRRPGTFERLWCFEPVVVPTDLMTDGPPGDSPMAEAAERRRETFPSYEDAIANFSSKPPLNVLTPEAMRAYVEHGFARQPDGSVRIKCRGATEAAIYRTGPYNGVWPRLGSLTVPVHILGGRSEGLGPGDFAPRVADQIPGARFTRMDSVGHFGPFQAPGLVAATVLAG